MRIASSRPKHTEEHKARMSLKFKGRAMTWGAKISVAVRKLSDQDITDILSAIGAGQKVKDLADKYGVHRTTISKVKMGNYSIYLSPTPSLTLNVDHAT